MKRGGTQERRHGYKPKESERGGDPSEIGVILSGLYSNAQSELVDMLVGLRPC